MWRLTIRNLAANKARFAMTTFAIVLGVGFVVASFVLSDGLRSTFGDLSEEITDGTDLVVRPVSSFGEPLPLDEDLAAEIAAIDGVEVAAPFIEAPESSVQPIKSDGTTISTSGPPQLTFGWIADEALGSFSIVAGEAPDEALEFTMDLDAATTHGFEIGETYDLVTPSGVVEGFTLVGTTSFGADNATVGATLMHVSVDQAQELWGQDGAIDQIPLRLESGSDAATVTTAINELVDPSSIEVVDQATITAEQEAEFDEGISIIGNVLLGFAIVSLFVSIFIIYNTFAIVLGQRIREIGLLRAIGANGKQIRRSIIGEALVVGTVASLIGIFAGVGVAKGLIGLFDALGLSLPDSPTILATRTIVIAILLGVGVTVISAIAPAKAAGSVSPIQALRDGGSLGREENRQRLVTGAAGLVTGLAVGSYGLFIGAGSTLGTVLALGLAAVLIFLGMTLAAPAVVAPVTRVAGWPIAKLMGTPGGLARENAGRNARRTATTGAALMIGLSLVTTGYVVGESVKSRLGDLIESTVAADYIILDDNETGLTPALAGDLEATGEFAAVSGMRYDDAVFGGSVREIMAMNVSAVDELFDIGVTEGSIPGPDETDVILLHTELATELGVGVGDTVPTEFASGYSTPLTVAAIYEDNTIFEDPIVAEQVFDVASAEALDTWVAAVLADGVTLADAAPMVAELQAQYPQVSIETSSEFQEGFEATIDDALMVINALLALAIVIALIGIANTLALSVHERTRELGLLRAVGMTRRQTRRMVRWEAALVSVFGAVLGVTVGLVFGWGVVEFGGSLAVPIVSIVQVVVIATAATLVAAWLPARRAGKLNVLDAISHS